jgi:ribosomal silencing factor RsfS
LYIVLNPILCVVYVDPNQVKKKELKAVDHASIDYIPFRKKLYIVPRALAALSEKEVQAVRDSLEIKVRGKGERGRDHEDWGGQQGDDLGMSCYGREYDDLYIPFRKKLYIVPRALAALSEKEVQAVRDGLEIKVRGKGERAARGHREKAWRLGRATG